MQDMVRPDIPGQLPPFESEGAGNVLSSQRVRVPSPVSTGAGSRAQAEGEVPWGRAGRQEPLRREQVHGPQQQVNVGAPSDEQSEC
jgi:hypothetical protein